MKENEIVEEGKMGSTNLDYSERVLVKIALLFLKYIFYATAKRLSNCLFIPIGFFIATTLPWMNE